MGLYGIVLDDDLGPNRRHQLILGNQRAFRLGEHGQQIERLAPNGDRNTAIQQLAKRLQGEPADLVIQPVHQIAPDAPTSLAKGRYRYSSTLALPGFFRKLSGRIKPRTKDQTRLAWNNLSAGSAIASPLDLGIIIFKTHIEVEGAPSSRTVSHSVCMLCRLGANVRLIGRWLASIVTATWPWRPEPASQPYILRARSMADSRASRCVSHFSCARSIR